MRRPRRRASAIVCLRLMDPGARLAKKRSVQRRGRGVRVLRAGSSWPVGGRVLTLVRSRALGGRALTGERRVLGGRALTGQSSDSWCAVELLVAELLVAREGAVPDRTSARSVHRRTNLLRLHLFWLHPHNTSTSKQIYKIIITSIWNNTNNTGSDMLLFCQVV